MCQTDRLTARQRGLTERTGVKSVRHGRGTWSSFKFIEMNHYRSAGGKFTNVFPHLASSRIGRKENSGRQRSDQEVGKRKLKG